MVINLSETTINTVYNSLRASKQSLQRQIKTALKNTDVDKYEVCRYQLNNINDALAVFEELMEVQNERD